VLESGCVLDTEYVVLPVPVKRKTAAVNEIESEYLAAPALRVAVKLPTAWEVVLVLSEAVTVIVAGVILNEIWTYEAAL
jgi:ABC-type molybdate transport system permease subunit